LYCRTHPRRCSPHLTSHGKTRFAVASRYGWVLILYNIIMNVACSGTIWSPCICNSVSNVRRSSIPTLHRTLRWFRNHRGHLYSYHYLLLLLFRLLLGIHYLVSYRRADVANETRGSDFWAQIQQYIIYEMIHGRLSRPFFFNNELAVLPISPTLPWKENIILEYHILWTQ